MSDGAIFSLIFGAVFGPVVIYAAIELASQYSTFVKEQDQ